MLLVRDIRDIGVHSASGASPAIHYQPVAAAGRSATKPPVYLLGPANAEVAWQLHGQIDTPAVGCYAITGATIAPTGIPIKSGIAFHADTFVQPRHHVVAISDRLNATKLPKRNVPGPLAVIYGPAHETWGHWLTDFLPRLWVLHAAGHDLATLRFLLPADLHDFARTLLLTIGLRADQLVAYSHWEELIHTDLALLPTGLRVENRLAPCLGEATAFWASRARAISTDPNLVTVSYPTRLFVSRRIAPQDRQLENRDDIEAMAQDHGLHVVHPEELSVPAQTTLFQGATLIAGEYGSALHNAVHSAPGTAICALRGTARHPSFIQSGIATALNHALGYVLGETDGEGADQRFRIDPGLFHQALILHDLA